MLWYHSVLFVSDTTCTLGARLARPTERKDTIRPSTEGLQTWSAKNTGRTPADYTPDFGRSLNGYTDRYEQLLVWAACCLGFFAFMRSGELTVPTGSIFDCTIHLTPRDITVDDLQRPTMLKIHVKSSKTDPTRKGVDLFVDRTGNSLCPVVAMLRYLSMRGIDDGPLFREGNGNPLSWQNLIAKVRQALQQAGVDPSHYSGHSFRIGAATTAASRSISDATIQILGRWSSDSYTRYIRTPRQNLASMSQLLAS